VWVLVEHLEAGDRLDDSLDDYRTVSRIGRSNCLRVLRRYCRAGAMRVLLAESTPRRLGSSLPDSFEIRAVQQMGWASCGNGARRA
jgi:hypothetical protein